MTGRPLPSGAGPVQESVRPLSTQLGNREMPETGQFKPERSWAAGAGWFAVAGQAGQREVAASVAGGQLSGHVLLGGEVGHAGHQPGRLAEVDQA